MTEESRLALQGIKSAGIILSLCEMFGVTPEQGAEIYYESETASLIEDCVAELQCRSDKYLATLIWEEFNESRDINRSDVATGAESADKPYKKDF